MSQRDQPDSGQRSNSGGRDGSNSHGRFGDDGFELPVWGDSSTSARPSSRAARTTRTPAAESTNEDRPARTRGSDRMPSLGDTLGRRGPRPSVPGSDRDFDADLQTPIDDSYERSRGRATRERQPVSVDSFGDEDWNAQTESIRERPRFPGADRPGRRRAEQPRQPRTSTAGVAVQFANQFERPVVITISIGVLSLVLMAATVAARQAKVADWMPIHLNAAGTPDHWGSPATLWRLPLIALMVTLMSAVLAWFASKRDAFAVQFILASTILIQALCWIALVNLAW